MADLRAGQAAAVLSDLIGHRRLAELLPEVFGGDSARRCRRFAARHSLKVCRVSGQSLYSRKAIARVLQEAAAEGGNGET